MAVQAGGGRGHHPRVNYGQLTSPGDGQGHQGRNGPQGDQYLSALLLQFLGGPGGSVAIPGRVDDLQTQVEPIQIPFLPSPDRVYRLRDGDKKLGGLVGSSGPIPPKEWLPAGQACGPGRNLLQKNQLKFSPDTIPAGKRVLSPRPSGSRPLCPTRSGTTTLGPVSHPVWRAWMCGVLS